MKYKSSESLTRQIRARRLRLALVLAVVLGVLSLVAVALLKGCDGRLPDVVEGVVDDEEMPEGGSLSRMRLVRDAIPAPDFTATPYYMLFADSNDIQLESAMACGVKDPDNVGDPGASKELVRIATSELYVVDTMYHSKPYLVPDAALMLWYIGERFQEVLSEEGHQDGHKYLPIVTSALRSTTDVDRLRRSNGNASENSCHRYGTTIDITRSKFLREDGELVIEDWLVGAMARALYELRYEGVCYVKYEIRQPCFHITLRSTNYQGNGKSREEQYPDIRCLEQMKKMPSRWLKKDN